MSIESNNKSPIVPSSFPYDKNKEKETSLKENKITEISKQFISTEINQLPLTQELIDRGSTQPGDNPVPKTVLSAIQPGSTLGENVQKFSKEKIAQLKAIFDYRFREEKRWLHDPDYMPDCGRFAYYLLTGKIGQFQDPEKEIPSINKLELGKVDLKKNQHKPYTVYAIYAPRTPEGTKVMGQYWAFQHYYMHIQDGYYVSTNGLGPIAVFDSYEKMLMADAFPMRIGTPGRFSTEDGEPTNDINQAVMGESEVGTIHNED